MLSQLFGVREILQFPQAVFLNFLQLFLNGHGFLNPF